MKNRQLEAKLERPRTPKDNLELGKISSGGVAWGNKKKKK